MPALKERNFMEAGVRIFRGPDGLALGAAEYIAEKSRERTQKQGRFLLCLSGGSTPRAAYALLAEHPFHSTMDWSRIHLFWGDERYVPRSHAQSNYRMVRETLLNHTHIPEENVHPFDTALSPEDAAGRYDREIVEFFRLSPGQWPRFDLILLGLGRDGHTASLFPGSQNLLVRDRIVAVHYGSKKQGVRLTMTLPVFNAGRSVLFLVSGKEKARILARIIQKVESRSRYPAGLVDPADGSLTWMVDRDAASDLSDKR
jgi:6-phosphogluconolactonase